MKVAVYSPYLDTFGGGEKYMLTIAEVLSWANNVEILLDKNLKSLGENFLKRQLSKRFDLDLTEVNFITGPVGKGSNFLQRLIFLKQYDLLFYLTDGSIFYPTSKKNILHIQSPLIGQPATSFWGKMKLKGWSLIIYNSKFTQENSKNNWPIISDVIYPPVDTDKIKPLKKKNYILSVGRFFGYLKDKKHKLLIDTFKDLYDKDKLNGWSLHLVGSASKGDIPYLDELKKNAKGFPINFYPNLAYKELVKLYGESSIYWHAAGYGEEDPIKMEHFGISTVEAMAGGCVPVVIKKGGQLEIVDHNVNGYLWNDLEQLENYTINLISKEKIRKKLSKNAIEKSKKFSKEEFKRHILNITLS